MAWTSPEQWPVGYLADAPFLNAQVRDNLLFLYGAPGARAYRTTNVSIANDTDTAISLTAEDFDTDTMHDNATNPSRLTINTPGYWAIAAGLRFGANATGNRSGTIRHSTDGILAGSNLPEVNASVPAQLSWGTYWPCDTAGEYVELYGYHRAGSAINAEAVAQSCPVLAAHWLSG